MKDPVREAFTKVGDKILINLDELKHIVYDKQFWLGTLSFAAMVLVVLMDGCMRRGV